MHVKHFVGKCGAQTGHIKKEKKGRVFEKKAQVREKKRGYADKIRRVL